VVSTRQDALQAWARGPFDLVLLDCDTPGVEGAATAACLRECEVGARRIPIVAMAAQRAGEEQTASWTSPIDGQIARPVCLEALAAVLERWLASPAVQARAASSESFSLPV
jgi:CheY-like chemotaxis protein